MEDLNILAEKVILELSSVNKKLFTAESCTAGLLSSTIANISGSSEILLGGITAYSNEIKQNILNVPHSIIEKFGAVSFECAFAMAEGALTISNANYVISITGIAGPTGGSDEKPIGTVFTAILSQNKEGWAQQFLFNGTRTEIRIQAVHAALRLLSATEKEEDFMDIHMCNAREFL